MENTGYEFSADYSIINKADLRWNVGFNLTFQKSVTSLPGGSDLVGGSSTEPTITQTSLLENESPNSLLDTNIGALILQMEIRSIIKQMVA
jgi:hypothetical protein